MLNITIKTIPHKKQRYATSGDYYKEKHKQHFRISEMQNKDYELLIALHELIEAYLCEKRRISWDSIDKFDINFEAERKPGNLDEPGDDPKAPYRKEHRFATLLEQLMAYELGINWIDYDEFVSKL